MANVTVTYTGAVADLLMGAGAVDQTGSYVFAVIPQVVQDGMAKGSSWMLDGGYDSMFTLWNPSNEPQDLVATFSYPDGSTGYKLPVHLDPYASMNIDMASLIAAQSPDADGNVIPRGTSEGWVMVSSAQGVRTKIKLALSSAAFNVITATCCPVCVCCEGTIDTYISPGEATVGETLTTQVSFIQEDTYGDFDSSCDATWWSANTSYATVAPPTSCPPYTPATVTGVAVTGSGTVTIWAEEEVSPGGMICNCSPNCYPYEGYGQALVTVTPGISSISPAQGLIGSSLTVTINGGGFGTSPTVNGGSGISVTVNSATDSQINATFNVSSSATGGNNSVSVTAGGQTSNQVNLYVQMPTHLARIAEPYTSNNGIGPLTTGTNITVYDANGNVYDNLAGVCGGYQWLSYSLEDQETTPQRITNGTVTFQEAFSNASPSSGDALGAPTPGPALTIDLSSSVLVDIYAIVTTNPPPCPVANGSDSVDQTWSATVGSNVYNLVTVIHITRQTNSQGLPSFTSDITTP
jgi:hypothetical protein